MKHGKMVRELIDTIQSDVTLFGSPVTVDGKGTIELMNTSYRLNFNDIIDIDNIRKELEFYFFEKNFDLKELQELEKSEYKKIEDEILEKAEQFHEDKHSRRVLWTDDCCISMIQYLIRNNTLHCFVNLRSSDTVYKLFSDLTLILNITRRLQIDHALYNSVINLSSNSFHIIAIDNLKKVN